jgi:hypothetical protein
MQQLFLWLVLSLTIFCLRPENGAVASRQCRLALLTTPPASYNMYCIVFSLSYLLRAPAGFCKQQLWPLFHYVLPMSPSSAGRFNSELWQAYVKANKVGSNILVPNMCIARRHVCNQEAASVVWQAYVKAKTVGSTRTCTCVYVLLFHCEADSKHMPAHITNRYVHTDAYRDMPVDDKSAVDSVLSWHASNSPTCAQRLLPRHKML